MNRKEWLASLKDYDPATVTYHNGSKESCRVSRFPGRGYHYLVGGIAFGPTGIRNGNRIDPPDPGDSRAHEAHAARQELRHFAWASVPDEVAIDILRRLREAMP